MTTSGATGTYAIYNQTLPLEPTEGNWVNQRELGRSGAGLQIVSPVFGYELKWGLMDKSEFHQLMHIYNSTSGSFVPCSLPDYDSDSYEFYSYTGCVVNKPQVSRYFNEHVTGVSLLITNINTKFFKAL